MANWYYAVGGQTEGPVDEEQLRSLARQGALTPSSFVIREGEQTWQGLSEVEAAIGLERNAWGTYADPPSGVQLAGPPESPSAPAAPGADSPGWGAPPMASAPQPAAPQAPAGWGAPPAGGGWGAPQPDPQQGAGWGAPPGAGWGQPPAWNEQAWTDPAAGSWAVPGTTGPNGAAYASWGARFAAKLIDFFVLFVPTLVVFFAVAGAELSEQLEESGTGVQLTSGPRSTVVSLVFAIAGLVYYAVLNGSGQTLGKKALGIKVVDITTGEPIGTGRGFTRHILQFFAALPILGCFLWIFTLVDGLWPLWDNQKQALHDKIARSVVVKAR